MFDFGCCSLAQEMSFVDCYLTYFRQQLTTHVLSALMFTVCLCREQLLTLSLLSSVLRAPCPFCCMFLFSSLFINQFFGFFLQCRESVCPGGYADLYQGGCGNTACHLFAHLLLWWMSPEQVWSRHLVARETSCFLSVTWFREALYRLGVQVV
jgi:hypothetical protein